MGMGMDMGMGMGMRIAFENSYKYVYRFLKSILNYASDLLVKGNQNTIKLKSKC